MDPVGQKLTKALGLAFGFSLKALGYLRWDPKWPYTRQAAGDQRGVRVPGPKSGCRLPNARTIRHAVSIDERRRPYVEYLVEATERSDLSEP